MNEKIKRRLVDVGFTQLESCVYLHLLREGPLTGYAIAKGIDKAVANVYKALDSLAQKGGVEQASGASKQCVAVPWRQLLESETKKFNSNIQALAVSLEALPERQDDEQIYQIKNAEHVKDYGIHMIEEAQHTVLASLEPAVLAWLEHPLVEAASRGVEVRVKLYEPANLPGVHTIIRQRGEEVYSKTRDVQFGVCVDGKEMLKAVLSLDTKAVIQAFRSKSALMALMAYEQLLYEFELTKLKQVIPEGNIQEAKAILADTVHLHVFSTENEVFKTFKDRYETQRK